MELLHLGISFLFFWIVYFKQQRRNQCYRAYWQQRQGFSFSFCTAAMSCCSLFTHFMRDLLEDVPVSMHIIQAALYTFITPYTNKSFYFIGTPATTHFVYFYTNLRANVIIRARYQAHTLNTKTCKMHVISGLQLKVASNYLRKWIVWKWIRFESWLMQLQCKR